MPWIYGLVMSCIHSADRNSDDLDSLQIHLHQILRFPEIIGVPPVIIQLDRSFPYKPSSYWGSPILRNCHQNQLKKAAEEASEIGQVEGPETSFRCEDLWRYDS